MQAPLVFDLANIRVAFPRAGKNIAATGRIPIEFFNLFERDFRAMMKREKLKAIYRGPRVSNANTAWRRSNNGKSATTRRCDAVAVMLYHR